MRIKRLSFAMLLAMAATLSFTSCSDDSLVGESGGSSAGSAGKSVYLNAALVLPSAAGTRSSTQDEKPKHDGNDETNSDGKYNDGGKPAGSDPDFEYGYDYENDVRTVLLVIANEDNEYITHTLIEGITQAPTTNTKFDFIVNGEIKHEVLEEAYEKGGLLDESKKVRIYAFCNYTDRLLKLFNGEITETVDGEVKNIKPEGTNWLDWTGHVDEAPASAGPKPNIVNTIWAPRSFLMSNSSMFSAIFPADIKDWDKYADKSTPFDLSDEGQTGNTEDYNGSLPRPIPVERAAARIDFRDGSDSDTPANTYPLKIVVKQNTKTQKGEGESESEPEGVADTDNDHLDENGNKVYSPFNVLLTRMALVNMSKNFYYLRRVSDDGFATEGKVKYLSPETNTNYVVDTDADAKGNNVSEGEAGITPANANNHFNFTLFKNETIDDYYQYNKNAWYADNIKDVLDNDKSDDTWQGKNTYKIWRYVTENTIPGIPQQKNVQSVGVVFKGSIRADVDEIKEAVYPETNEPYVSAKVQEALAEAAKEKDEERNRDKMPTLYSFENLLYASVDEMVDAALTKEGQGSTLYGALQVVLSNWILDGDSQTFNFDAEAAKHLAQNTETDIKYIALTPEICSDILNGTSIADKDGKYKTYKIDFMDDNFVVSNKKYDAVKIQKFMTTAPKSNITVYEPSDEEDGEGYGYYCYYFYWNRHNDNLKSGRMGNMEFATVRNNVYKLAVTKINKFGHPGIPGHDPDPSEPEDPDEEELDYIQVRVEVLPWVVRVNDIEF